MTGVAPTIAVVGDNTIDRFLDVPGDDLVGGNALNVAVQASLLGATARYYGAVGTDAEADIVRRAAAAQQVDLSGLVTRHGATALTTIRRTAEGDRVFESEEFGVTAHYVPDADTIARIAEADWIHLGMQPDAGRLKQAIVDRNPRARISQDLSVTPGLSQLTVAFASAGEDEEQARSFLDETVGAGIPLAIATLGSRGAVAASAFRSWRVPAEQVSVVDTTGAGDSFIAGFIVAYLATGDVSEALAAGARRGGYTCGYRGGWPQEPLRGSMQLRD